MAITYLKKELPRRTNQHSDREAPKPGEGTAQSLPNQDHTATPPYVRSHCTFDDGSSLNGRNASTVFKPRERAKQMDSTPVLGGPESPGEGVGTDRNTQDGAEEKAPVRAGHVNISPGAKFANRDMRGDEFLEYFCGRRD
ncbi:hypothetical protein N7489_004681 [Penicillium chrysogenum]|uniref:uncharacterized protein n=1 Tax=Penicillium chrysogenum TaxID=5076 RepID=UPI0024DF159F|nr:uncharacterized protein N7489_004681 [Penicillium chrysogenum]KAJ5244585.1 hypothetical protein N7489_004681 [Penicillium chrysogenum]KAJ5853045.1 hypothetical protein N7534_005588 [Penicillium rubens]